MKFNLVLIVLTVLIFAFCIAQIAGAQSPTPSSDAQHWMPSAVWVTPTETPRVFTSTLGTVYVMLPTPTPTIYNPTGGVGSTALVQSVTGPSGPSLSAVTMYPPGSNLPPVSPVFNKPQQDMIFERLARQCGIKAKEILNSFTITGAPKPPAPESPIDPVFTVWETDTRTAKYFFDALARCAYYQLPAGDKLMLAIDQAAHYSFKVQQASGDAILIDLTDPALKVKVVGMLTALMNLHASIIAAGGGLE